MSLDETRPGWFHKIANIENVLNRFLPLQPPWKAILECWSPAPAFEVSNRN